MTEPNRVQYAVRRRKGALGAYRDPLDRYNKRNHSVYAYFTGAITGAVTRCFFIYGYTYRSNYAVTLPLSVTITVTDAGLLSPDPSYLKRCSLSPLSPPSHHPQHTRECLKKIGIEEEGRGGQHGQDAILKLIAAIMHLLNVEFKAGKCAQLCPCVEAAV